MVHTNKHPVPHTNYSMETMVSLKCESPPCGREFLRRATEYNRKKKIGRPNYCSRSCASRESRPAKNPPVENLIPGARAGGGRKRTELSPFYPFIAKIKSRGLESDLDVYKLKTLWDDQHGICPITGWRLNLNPCNGDKRDRVPDRASLDKIDPQKGYMTGNVRWIAYIANLAKGTWSDEVVIKFAKDVVDRST